MTDHGPRRVLGQQSTAPPRGLRSNIQGWSLLRLQQALHQQRCVRCSFHQTCRRDDFHASGRCMPGYSVQRSPLSPKATLMARQSKLAPRHSGCSTVSTQYSSAAAAGRLGGSKVANTDHSPSSSRWMTGAGSCGCSVRADSCLAGAGRCGASCTRWDRLQRVRGLC